MRHSHTESVHPAIVEETLASWADVLSHPQLELLDLAQRLIWVGRLLDEALTSASSESGLSKPEDHEVLALVRRYEPGGILQVEISDSLRLSRSGVTGKIDRLERQGFVERQPDNYDRRAVRVRLTPDGARVLKESLMRRLSVYEHALLDFQRRDRMLLARSLKMMQQRLYEEPGS